MELGIFAPLAVCSLGLLPPVAVVLIALIARTKQHRPLALVAVLVGVFVGLFLSAQFIYISPNGFQPWRLFLPLYCGFGLGSAAVIFVATVLSPGIFARPSSEALSPKQEPPRPPGPSP
jgi:hypothetical protein